MYNIVRNYSAEIGEKDGKQKFQTIDTKKKEGKKERLKDIHRVTFATKMGCTDLNEKKIGDGC